MDDETLEIELREISVRTQVELCPINVREIIVNEWVSWKCKFGCKNFAKHFCCPPYVPRPSETRALLREYQKAFIVHFRGIPGMEEVKLQKVPDQVPLFRKGLALWIHDTMYELEQHAFYRGYYKSLAFSSYPCTYCKECVLEAEGRVADLSLKRDCRHSEKVRPSMEAVGIDVFATVRKLNLPIDVIPCEDNVHGRITTSNINSYGLLLLF